MRVQTIRRALRMSLAITTTLCLTTASPTEGRGQSPALEPPQRLALPRAMAPRDPEVRRTTHDGSYPTAQSAAPAAPTKPQPTTPVMMAPTATPTYASTPVYSAPAMAPVQMAPVQMQMAPVQMQMAPVAMAPVPMAPTMAAPVQAPNPNFFMTPAPVQAPAPVMAPTGQVPTQMAPVQMTPVQMQMAPVAMAPVPMAPTMAAPGVAGLVNQSFSVPTTQTKSRVRIRSRPLGGLAQRLGEKLQNYGRTRIETSQEIEVAPGPQTTSGAVTTISTTGAIPQAPQQQALMFPQSAPPQSPPPVPQAPVPSPQGTSKHNLFHHHD